MIFSNFTIFWLWEHIAREWEVIEFCENSWSSFNSLETNDGQTFWHKLQDSMTTQPPAIRSQTRKIGKFVKIMAQTFLNCDNMCDLTVLLASICYRKTAAFWHYLRYSTSSQTRTISSQRPKGANLRDKDNLRRHMSSIAPWWHLEKNAKKTKIWLG